MSILIPYGGTKWSKIVKLIIYGQMVSREATLGLLVWNVKHFQNSIELFLIIFQNNFLAKN